MAGKRETWQIEDLWVFFARSQLDPAFFILWVWWLSVIENKEKFVRWETLTQHQSLLVEQVRKAVNWEAGWMISVRSGHWVGKSSICAMLILWFLYCFPKSQIATTAPTADLLRDILWKELSFWKSKMPEYMWNMCEISDWYARMKEAPAEWFARARTASKDKPEALAWIHWDYVMLLWDEASWVLEEAYNSSQWALTWPFKLFILISNPTRLTGYFYNTHKKFNNRERLHFNSEDSPIVDNDFLDKIIQEHWKESEEYKIRVLWEFPDEDNVDDKWYNPLILRQDIRIIHEWYFEPLTMWVDIAWEWKDKTVRVVRWWDIAKIVAKENVSNPYGIAVKTKELAERLWIYASDVFIDFFWIWWETGVELAKMWFNVTCVSVWEKAKENNRFLNLRAELYWKLKEWLSKWAKLVGNWRDDLLINRYKRTEKWLIKMMSKEDMRKLYWKSPDCSDALMLTMMFDDSSWIDFNQVITQKR